jgi:AbrB family looped-hinge helix DNA binding protein
MREDIMKIKVDSRGKITIPKKMREKYGLTRGIEVEIDNYDGIIRVKPAVTCSACKKALPKELYTRDACAECTPIPRKTTVIY